MKIIEHEDLLNLVRVSEHVGMAPCEWLAIVEEATDEFFVFADKWRAALVDQARGF